MPYNEIKVRGKTYLGFPNEVCEVVWEDYFKKNNVIDHFMHDYHDNDIICFVLAK